MDEGVIDREDEPAALGFVDQPLRLLRGRRHRLLDEHVLAGLQRLHREVEVARDRRGDRDRVDARIAAGRRRSRR